MPNTYKSLKAWLSFQLGKNPRIEPSRSDYRRFIPEPYQGVVIVSADFELAWAWRFDKQSSDPLTKSLELAQRERTNIPLILNECNKYNVPVTWGTVGHLFLEKCLTENGKHHPELRRIPYFENEWWRYNEGDWFDHDPCSTCESAPEWYAPDLIRTILESYPEHEIASHSFSHISCTDLHCHPEVLRDELDACKLAAEPFGVNLESFIFPGHTMGNYETLRSKGYSSMRTNFINVLGYPQLHPNGLWEHKTTLELFYNPLFSVEGNLQRYRTILTKCIRNKQVCNLWFHPSFGKTDLELIMPGVFDLINQNREDLWVTTMKNYTNWLNKEYAST